MELVPAFVEAIVNVRAVDHDHVVRREAADRRVADVRVVVISRIGMKRGVRADTCGTNRAGNRAHDCADDAADRSEESAERATGGRTGSRADTDRGPEQRRVVTHRLPEISFRFAMQRATADQPVLLLIEAVHRRRADLNRIVRQILQRWPDERGALQAVEKNVVRFRLLGFSVGRRTGTRR